MFFLLALTPLLLLKHQSPQDSEVVLRLLRYCYAAATLTSMITALSYALAGTAMPTFATAALLAICIVMRRQFIPAIHSLRASPPFGKSTVSQFRKLHMGAIATNLIQLMAVVGIINGCAPI